MFSHLRYQSKLVRLKVLLKAIELHVNSFIIGKCVTKVLCSRHSVLFKYLQM